MCWSRSSRTICRCTASSAIYAREGVDLDRSLLAKWVGHGASLMQPLVDALRRHVMAATKLHADDTPVPVARAGNGRTKPDGCGSTCATTGTQRHDAAAVWFAYTADRKGIHPQQHLESFSGTLQAECLWRIPGDLPKPGG
ncbi:IS66 family transposase [Burkholderia pseudomallei]|uniref:IS66 family transposase n=1 Tax=Burkholderia pseudomallei TaxID=28450 RepID=UPI002409D81C|nr:transposase [Burkholderia pseudomallei]